MRRIVFIFHEATLTGAPVLLYRFLKYLHDNNSGWEVQLLFQKTGPLVPLAQQLFPVTVLNENPGISFPQRLNTWVRKGNNKKKLKSLFDKKVDLVYSNTIANGLLLDSLHAMTDAKILLHIHELPLIIKEFGMANHEMNLKYADAIIFNSKLTANEWPADEKLDTPSRIIYPFIDELNLDTLDKSHSPNFVIGGCGNFTWRKGIESFIFVAKEIAEKRKDVRFKWIGGNPDSVGFIRLSYLLEKLGLKDIFEFIPSTSEPEDYFKLFDLVFVSSYEEPFSMVAAECGALGIPLVCYQNCTGAAELFIPDAGIAVPAGLHHDAAIEIMQLLDDRDMREKMGARAKEITLEKTNKEINSQQIIDFIEELINT